MLHPLTMVRTCGFCFIQVLWFFLNKTWMLWSLVEPRRVCHILCFASCIRFHMFVPSINEPTIRVWAVVCDLRSIFSCSLFLITNLIIYDGYLVECYANIINKNKCQFRTYYQIMWPNCNAQKERVPLFLGSGIKYTLIQI